MYSFYFDLRHALDSGRLTLFLLFFVYVWVLWTVKVVLARRYRPYTDPAGATAELTTTVLIPVYDEPLEGFERVLQSVRRNNPTEMIVIVDGGAADLVAVAARSADQVLPIEKAGKRAAIWAGVEASAASDVYLVVDSDTVWADDLLVEILKPLADPAVGGVTPRQAIIHPGHNNVKRMADWLEDLRYSLTAPMQSCFGQIGCLAGRTIAYRREAFLPAAQALVAQRVLGVPMAVGDDRVLTNGLLRDGWKSVLQSTAAVETDAPTTWSRFWRQQLRWGRSSQRETLLCARWLWRKPMAALIFVTDMVVPFVVFTLFTAAVVDTVVGGRDYFPQVPLWGACLIALIGMNVSIGLRQTPHFRHRPRDLLLLPMFVIQLTFFMVPTRLIAFATMFHNNWETRPSRGDSQLPDHHLRIGLRTRQRVLNIGSALLAGAILTAIVAVIVITATPATPGTPAVPAARPGVAATVAAVPRAPVAAAPLSDSEPSPLPHVTSTGSAVPSDCPTGHLYAPSSSGPVSVGDVVDPWHIGAFQRATKPYHVQYFGWFENWATAASPGFADMVSPMKWFRQAEVAHVTPYITWEPFAGEAETTVPAGWTTQEIAAGSQDSYISMWARAIRAYGKPVYLRLAQEMNGTWYPWSASPSGYIAMWRHVVTVFRNQKATNARFVWAPNGNGYQTLAQWCQGIAQYWPGAAYVSAVGMTTIDFGSGTHTPLTDAIMTQRLNVLRTYDKPVDLPEVNAAWGVRAFWFSEIESLVQHAPWIQNVIISQAHSEHTPVTGSGQSSNMNWSVIKDPVTLKIVRQIMAIRVRRAAGS